MKKNLANYLYFVHSPRSSGSDAAAVVDACSICILLSVDAATGCSLAQRRSPRNEASGLRTLADDGSFL